ncbi:MAG: tetratricopeptide repeat protein, partial [Ilumatobacteraceae bacterium]
NVAMEMLDASALLWRLHLDDIDVGNRWQPLADSWAEKDPGPWYAFNDMHAALAFVASEHMHDAEAMISRLQTYVAQPDPRVTNKDMVARVGLPIVRAVVAHGKGNYAECARLLDPIRNNVAIFGGSHAQRDVVQRTLIDALQKSGDHARAEQLLRERLHDRPTSVWSSKRLARSYPIS